MYHARDLDDFLNDPAFLASEEYKFFKDVADCCGKSIKEIIIKFHQVSEEDRLESLRIWPEEIKFAIEAERKKRLFPPMLRLSECILHCIETGDFNSIPKENWIMLADFLAGYHRGHRGRSIVDYRSGDMAILSEYVQLQQQGASPSKAQEMLAEREQSDLRTIQRTIKRAEAHRNNEEIMQRLSKHDMNRFFRDDT